MREHVRSVGRVHAEGARTGRRSGGGAHITLSPDAVQTALGLWLRRQWLQRQRSEPGRTTWRARRGPAADLRRGLDVLRTLELKGVDAIEVRAHEGLGVRGDFANVQVPVADLAVDRSHLASP